jgi:hypothetical protein
MIKKNSATWHPAYVSDYMPTILEVLGVKHEHPDWAADGISLMPLHGARFVWAKLCSKMRLDPAAVPGLKPACQCKHIKELLDV